MADLVEAVYAGGASGWQEADLVEIVQRAFSGKADHWVVARTLRDASIIQPRLRSRWRGRIWTLEPPTLRRVGRVTLLDGAVCERLVQNFRKACLASGGEPFRRAMEAVLAPALVGCRGGDAGAVAERLGWRILDGRVVGLNKPMSFLETRLVLLGREPSHHWDWGSRRFVPGPGSGKEAVGIMRWVQPGGNDHDIYTVEEAGRARKLRFVSRNAAVCVAHCIARVPMFKAADGRISCLFGEAALPDFIAAVLRIRHCLNSGLSGDGCVYKADGRDLTWVKSLLPGIVASQDEFVETEGADAVSAVRHSGGRSRIAWLSGRLTSW